jgi:L-lactate dehydrogenase
MQVAVIGAGRVGGAVANELVRNDSIDYLGILDRNLEKSRGLWADLINANPSYLKKLFTGSYEWASDADIVILSAGIAQNRGQSREELLEQNLKITTEILSKIEFKPSAKLIVVTNPVDSISLNAMRFSGLPPQQIIGFGGDLDTLRLKLLLEHASRLENAPDKLVRSFDANLKFIKSINAHVIGGHGELAISVYRNSPKDPGIESSVKEYASAVIERTGATVFGPAAKIAELVDDIIHDRKKLHHVSYFNKDEGVFLTWPCIIGKAGVIKPLELSLNEDEKRELRNVIAHLKELDEKKIRPEFAKAARTLSQKLEASDSKHDFVRVQ